MLAGLAYPWAAHEMLFFGIDVVVSVELAGKTLASAVSPRVKPLGRGMRKCGESVPGIFVLKIGRANMDLSGYIWP